MNSCDVFKALVVPAEGDNSSVTAREGQRRDLCIREIKPAPAPIPNESLSYRLRFSTYQIEQLLKKTTPG